MPRPRLVPALLALRRGLESGQGHQLERVQAGLAQGASPSASQSVEGSPLLVTLSQGIREQVPLPPPAPRASFVAHTVRVTVSPPPFPHSRFPACPDLGVSGGQQAGKG